MEAWERDENATFWDLVFSGIVFWILYHVMRQPVIFSEIRINQLNSGRASRKMLFFLNLDKLWSRSNVKVYHIHFEHLHQIKIPNIANQTASKGFLKKHQSLW